jgi:hypothetical protein
VPTVKNNQFFSERQFSRNIGGMNSSEAVTNDGNTLSANF